MCHELKFLILFLCINHVKPHQRTKKLTTTPPPVHSRDFDDQQVIDLLAEVLHDPEKLELFRNEIRQLRMNNSLDTNSFTLRDNSDALPVADDTSPPQAVLEPNQTQCQTYTTLPANCQEVKDRGHFVSGIYLIRPQYAAEPFFVMCDLKTNGGGWTYVLNRYNGFQRFNKSWNDYKAGFGNLAGESWLGLDKLRALTGYEINELLIELVDWHDIDVYAMYSSFSIGSEKQRYAITILDGYSGTAGDSFSYHAGSAFSTPDRESHSLASHCAEQFDAGWWYNACRRNLLTGTYSLGEDNSYKSMHWETFHGHSYSLKQVRMMIRPQQNKLSSICSRK